MSNFLAPATITAALALLLEELIALDVTDFTFNVTTERPDEVADDSGAFVNVYLYQVTPNIQWRNSDLPTRNARGQLLQRPRAALDLHYLFSFYGDESELQPQRLLGSTTHILHSQPVLTPAWVEYARTHTDYPFLTASDLGNEIERVKFTPQAFSLEELSKLWSVFFQTPYHLSVAFIASVVFVEPQDQPARALPVLEREVTAIPSATATPTITPGDLSGVQLWLRSDLDVTFDIDGVSEWRDQSGNDRHASQNDLGQRPIFLAHGIGRFPVLRFDGIDDRLALDWSFNSAISAVTVCAIVRTDSGASQAVISFDGDEYWELQASDGTATPRVQWLTADGTPTVDGLIATQATDNTQWHALYAEFSAAGADDKQLIIDGVYAGAASAHSTDIGTGATRFGLIGAASNATTFDGAVSGRFHAGDIGEIVVYDRILTDDERSQLESYFARRYSNV